MLVITCWLSCKPYICTMSYIVNNIHNFIRKVLFINYLLVQNIWFPSCHMILLYFFDCQFAVFFVMTSPRACVHCYQVRQGVLYEILLRPRLLSSPLLPSNQLGWMLMELLFIILHRVIFYKGYDWQSGFKT